MKVGRRNIPTMAYNVASNPAVTPAAVLSVGGVPYYEHWRCPRDCGYRVLTDQPFDNGDADSYEAAHSCP